MTTPVDILPMSALASWPETVRRLGLAPDPRHGTAWSTTRDDATLVVEVESLDDERVRLRAWVTCSPTTMALRRVHALSGEARLLIGDASFDDVVSFFDQDPTILGALDAPTRAGLRDLIEAGASVSRGALRLPGSIMAANPRRLESALLSALRVGQRLSSSRAARLQSIVTLTNTDPLPGVRRHLHRVFSDHPEVRAVAGDVPTARGPQELMALIVDPWGSRADRVQALSALVHHSAIAEVAPLVPRVPADLIEDLTETLVMSLGERRITPPVGLSLVAYLDHNPAMSDKLRVRLLEALGATRHPVSATWLGAMCDVARREVFEAALAALLRLDLPNPDVSRLLSPHACSRAVLAAPDLVCADPSLDSSLLLALMERVERHQHGTLRRYLEALVVIEDPRAADVAKRELGSADEGVRAAAIAALAALGGPTHVCALAAVDHPNARAAIARIQARVGAHLRGGVSVVEGGARGGVSLCREA